MTLKIKFENQILAIFDLRFHYETIFGEDDPEMENQKMVKIRYECNLLVSMNEDENGTIMDALSKSDELDLFTTQLVIETINFKWEKFAQQVHYFGTGLHFAYAICLIWYIKWTFIISSPIIMEDLVP